MHTTKSDGSLSPLDLYKQAVKLKIKHISITDHHNTEAYSIIDSWLNKNKRLCSHTKLWTGIEITSLLDGCLVHILGIGFDQKCKSLDKYCQNQSVIGQDLECRNLIKSIHDANGLAILAHPARYRKSFSSLIKAAKECDIDGVEVWYDYERSSIWTPTELICNKINDLRLKYNLLSTCGTDTHGLSIIKR